MTLLLIINIGLIILLIKFDRNISVGERITTYENHSKIYNTSLSIVIPTYNEEKNIERLLYSIIKSQQPCTKWKVLIVDDGSTDNTITKAKRIIASNKKIANIVTIKKASERPKGELWVGKNWPCHVGSKDCDSEWILFIDADIELSHSCIKDSLSDAIISKTDLLSLAPRLNCNCLGEWIIQPIMSILFGIGFSLRKINNKNSTVAFAAGPFMLFKNKSYRSIGGHESVKSKVVEDIALAHRIKKSNMKLRYLIGIDNISLNMYTSLKEIWEGWSKNMYIGLGENITKSIILIMMIIVLFTYPWIKLGSLIIKILFLNDSLTEQSKQFLLTGTAISLHYLIRLLCYSKIKIKTDYWWTSGVGGLLVSGIVLSSIFKTITGVGWTWKGRKLRK